MCESVHEVFRDAKYQCCTVHFYRSIMSNVSRNRLHEMAMMLNEIHAQESKGAKEIEQGIEETLTYMDFLRHREHEFSEHSPTASLH